MRLKSSSRKRKKKEKQSELPAEGDGVPAVDFPLEGNTSKPDYRASAGPTLPLSVDAERYKSSGAGRYYLHHSEEGGVVSLPSVTTSEWALGHVIYGVSRDFCTFYILTIYSLQSNSACGQDIDMYTTCS